jgi:hypothetical protein
MLRIADVAKQCDMAYKDFYALVWLRKIPTPTHPVPLRKKLHYTAEEAREIVRQVREYQEALAE